MSLEEHVPFYEKQSFDKKDIIKKRNEVSSEHEAENKEPIHAKKKRTKGKNGKQNK